MYLCSSVKAFPPATANELNPSCSGFFHNCRGPSLGHFLRVPLSGELPSEAGPRYCGQSAPKADIATTHNPKPQTKPGHLIGNLTREEGKNSEGIRPRIA